jgi:flagellar motor switch protein FliM
MKFSQLLPVPIEDLSDDELDALVQKMDLSDLKQFEKKIRKAGAKKKTVDKKRNKARDAISSLIAEGLSTGEN